MSNQIKFLSVLGAALLLIIYAIAGITTIQPGYTGLRIKMLGTGQGVIDTISTGTTWIEPFTYDVKKYDSRSRQYPEEKQIPSSTKDGQPIEVDVSLEIGLDSSKIPKLHNAIGSDWYERVVLPALRAEMRNEPAQYLSDVAYTGVGRRAIQDHVQSNLRFRYAD